MEDSDRIETILLKADRIFISYPYALHLSIAHGLHSSRFLCSDTTLSQVASKIGIRLVHEA